MFWYNVNTVKRCSPTPRPGLLEYAALINNLSFFVSVLNLMSYETTLLVLLPCTGSSSKHVGKEPLGNN